MNILSAQQLITDRIVALVPGFTTVGSASLVAGLRDIGPLLPGCFIVPGGAEIGAQQRNGEGVLENQEWVAVIIVDYQHTDSTDGLTESSAGEFMAGVIHALSGWRPGQGFTSPFVYIGREDPIYGLGYAEFPLAFKVTALAAPYA